MGFETPQIHAGLPLATLASPFAARTEEPVRRMRFSHPVATPIRSFRAGCTLNNAPATALLDREPE